MTSASTARADKQKRTVLNLSPDRRKDLDFLVADRTIKDDESCSNKRFMSDLIRGMAQIARTGKACFESRYLNDLACIAADTSRAADAAIAVAAVHHDNGHRKKAPPARLKRAS